MKVKDYYLNQSVIITGGSSGIGKSLAEQLVKEGANVFLIARNSEKLEKVINGLQKLCVGKNQIVEGFSSDISIRNDISSVIQKITKKQPIDILINNAGEACCNYFEATTPEEFEKMINIDYLGMVWATRAILAHFKERHAGKIVNVSSLSGVIGIIGYSAYSPAKYAVVGFSDVLRNELKPYNIQVSIVFPSDVLTPQLEAENQTKPAETVAISGTINPYEPDVVAFEILKSVTKNKYEIVPGFMGKVTFYLNRYFPSLFRWILDDKIRRFKNKTSKGK